MESHQSLIMNLRMPKSTQFEKDTMDPIRHHFFVIYISGLVLRKKIFFSKIRGNIELRKENTRCLKLFRNKRQHELLKADPVSLSH